MATPSIARPNSRMSHPPMSPSKSISFGEAPQLSNPILPAILNNDEVHASSQPLAPLQRNPSLRRLANRSSLLRRSSSFGAAFIVQAIEPQPNVNEQNGKLSNSMWRWLILLLCCLLLFGNYYAYDCIAALNKPLQEWLGSDYDTYQYQLNLLYSVYSFPNIILPFIGGQLVDKVDSRSVLILFSLFVCAGQTLFSIGVSSRQFALMVAGRVLFGIGGECISVVQASLTTTWFKGKELAFALGLNLCIARFGSVVNALLSPRIQVVSNVPTAVWFGAFMCYLSFVAAVALVFVMSRQTLKTKNQVIDSRNDSSNFCVPLLDKQAPFYSKNNIAIKCKQALADIRLLPFTFWLLCLICVLLYGTVVPFNNIVSDFLQSKWFPGDAVMAGNVMCIPDTMSAILVPICGILVDKYGHRASLLVACALVIAGVHIVLGLTMTNPVIPLIFLGLSYSMYGVAIWPSIATIIQHEEEAYHQSHMLEPDLKLLGTAYGLSTSALNMALTIFPLIAAQVRVWGNGFVMVECFFALLAIAGALASALLYIVDARNGRVLEKPELATYEKSDDETPLLNDHNPRERVSDGNPEELGRTMLYRKTSAHPSNNSNFNGLVDAAELSNSSGSVQRQWLHRKSSTQRFFVEPES